MIYFFAMLILASAAFFVGVIIRILRERRDKSNPNISETSIRDNRFKNKMLRWYLGYKICNLKCFFWILFVTFWLSAHYVIETIKTLIMKIFLLLLIPASVLLSCGSQEVTSSGSNPEVNEDFVSAIQPIQNVDNAQVVYRIDAQNPEEIQLKRGRNLLF